ncbi:Bor family protein [Methylococcus mesophilus]|uniref:Bor family protein n=1 Tax=Methylococcus mesophilus TaxID=2993564 RepID=UPI0029391A8B|nr:Bor family protein [Methylococcus mesophilus]
MAICGAAWWRKDKTGGYVKIICYISAAALLFSGCATQTFNLTGGGSAMPTQDVRQPFFLSGIGQTRTLDAAGVCGDAGKVAKVETITTGMDGLLGAVTFGIYTPRHARVYCK